MAPYEPDALTELTAERDFNGLYLAESDRLGVAELRITSADTGVMDFASSWFDRMGCAHHFDSVKSVTSRPSSGIGSWGFCWEGGQ
jgi:hypothetical protein